MSRLWGSSTMGTCEARSEARLGLRFWRAAVDVFVFSFLREANRKPSHVGGFPILRQANLVGCLIP